MQNSESRQQLILLLIVLGLAFALRIWGVGYGLPHSYTNDEYHEIMRAFELGAGSFNFTRIGKGGLYYLLFVEYGIYFVGLKLLGVVSSPTEFAALFVRDPSMFYYIGRISVVCMGTLTVWLVFLIARRAYATGAGLLAAAFLAVDTMHSELSQRILVDAPMVFFAIASLLMAIRLSTEGRKRDYIWAAVFASLATTTKIPAIVLVVPLLVAHSYYVRDHGGGIRQLILSRDLWIGAAVFSVILLATNPGIVYAYKMVGLYSSGGIGATEALLEEGDLLLSGSERPNLYLYYLRALQSSMGWPLFVVGMAGVSYAAWKRTPADVVLLSGAVAFYVAIASTTSDMYFSRYVLPVSVIVLILAGRVVHDLWRSTRSANVVLLATATIVFIAFPAYQSIASSYVYSQTDTRTLAKEWIELHLPEGSRVLLEGAKVAPARNTVPLRDTEANLRRRIDYWSKEEPRQAEFLRYKLRVLEGKTFDLVLVPLSDVDNLQAYRDMQVEYFVITPRFYDTGFSKGTSERSVQLVNELRDAPDIKLLKRFEADQSARPGPTVDIYGLDPLHSDEK